VQKFTIEKVSLYILPAPMRVPLRFGAQTLTQTKIARVAVLLKSGAEITMGWGETPLSVGWFWPSKLDFELREKAMVAFCEKLCERLCNWQDFEHPFEASHEFIKKGLHELSEVFDTGLGQPLPHLASLVAYSAFDIALYDAFAKALGLSVFECLSAKTMSKDLSAYLEADNDHSFKGEYPCDFLQSAPKQLKVWHLVGGLDPLSDEELKGDEPKDGYPVTLQQWIVRDGLTCLKIKLKGDQPEWDLKRIIAVGEIALQHGVDWLSTDFNCVVTEAGYVNNILDQLCASHPKIYGMLLYVEQPFPYDIEKHPLDVHSCSARKPLFMDESAHDWTYVRMGYRLGWTGVALKTCKTFTGALLSLCWAKAHGMTLMVQDLTNPMLAQIPHVQLAAHAGTIMGVESNGMQFYPEVSRQEANIHPRLYTRKHGVLDLSSLSELGFGYREEEIARVLPTAICEACRK